MTELELKITDVPKSKPHERLEDLIDLIQQVDAPIGRGPAEMAARAWIVIESMAIELGRLSERPGPEVPLGTLLGMFALGMCSPTDTDSQAPDPQPASTTTSSSG